MARKEAKIEQTDEPDIAKLVVMAKEELASGKAKYIIIGDLDPQRQKMLMWIIDHSPKWRSAGSAVILEEMRRLGI